LLLADNARRFAPAAICFAIAAICLPNLPQAALTTADFIRTDHADSAKYQTVIGELTAARGPVACELLSLCYWAGKSFEIDFFNYGQKLKKRRVTATLLTSRFDSGYYAYVETTGLPDSDSETSGYLGPDIAQHISAHYRPVDTVGQATLLAPR